MTRVKFNADGSMIAVAATKGEIAARKAIEEKLKNALGKFDGKFKKADAKRSQIEEKMRGLEEQLDKLRGQRDDLNEGIQELIDDSSEDLTMLQEELEDAGGKMLLPTFLQREYGFLAGKKTKKNFKPMGKRRDGAPVLRHGGSGRSSSPKRRRGGGSGIYGA